MKERYRNILRLFLSFLLLISIGAGAVVLTNEMFKVINIELDHRGIDTTNIHDYTFKTMSPVRFSTKNDGSNVWFVTRNKNTETLETENEYLEIIEDKGRSCVLRIKKGITIDNLYLGVYDLRSSYEHFIQIKTINLVEVSLNITEIEL